MDAAADRTRYRGVSGEIVVAYPAPSLYSMVICGGAGMLFYKGKLSKKGKAAYFGIWAIIISFWLGITYMIWFLVTCSKL